MSSLHKKIKLLNESYQDIKTAIKIIELNTQNTTDMNTKLWRLKKMFEEVQKEIYKQLEIEDVNNQFKNIIKGIDKK